MWLVDVMLVVAYLLAVAPVAWLLTRDAMRTRGGGPARPPDTLEAEQIATLWTGDDEHMVVTSLTPLRWSGVLRADEEGRLSVSGTALAGASDLTRAVHAAIGQGGDATTLAQVLRDPSVVAEAGRIRQELTDRGLLLGQPQRRRIVRDRLIVAGLGLVPVVFVVVRIGLLAVPGLIALAVGAAFLVLLLMRARRTAAGESLLREIVSTQARLDPAGAPEWSELTPSSMGLAVAIYGTIVLTSADPEFAAAARIEGRRTDATNLSSGGVGDDGATPGYWGGHLA